MRQSTMCQKSYQVFRFMIIQFIVLIGWVVIQSFFSLLTIDVQVPFSTIVLIEAISWLLLLTIMLYLFLLEYGNFVRAVLDLEQANKRLRLATNLILQHTKSRSPRKRSVEVLADDME